VIVRVAGRRAPPGL